MNTILKRCSAALMAVTWSLSAPAAVIEGTPVGNLGGTYGFPSAVSAQGAVVGYHLTANNQQQHAYYWSSSEGTVDLGTLGGSYSYAQAVNAHGAVVGQAARSNGSTSAFYWSKTTGMVDIGDPSWQYSYAIAINDAGQVLGLAYTPDGHTRSFLWTQSAGHEWVDPIDVAGAGYSSASPQRLTPSGRVMGHYYDGTTGRQHAYYWSRDTGALVIPHLPNATYQYGYGHAINDVGAVVGQTYGQSGYQAFYWSQATGTLDLTGHLPNQGNHYSYARDINDSGLVVAQHHGYDTTTGQYFYRPFYWRLGSGLQFIALPGNAQYADIFGLNPSGLAVMYVQGQDGAKPYLWSESSGLHAVPMPSANATGYGYALSATGRLVGYFYDYSVYNGARGFAWRIGEAVDELIVAGAYEAVPHMVSAGGLPVGYAYSSFDGSYSTYVWGSSGPAPDTTPPVITLNGDALVTLEACSAYVDAHATALDDRDGDLSAAITVTGQVASGTPGTYQLHYNVQDAAGNAATTVTRTVQVVDTTAPQISALTVNPSSLWPANHKMVNAQVGYSAADSCSASVSCSLSVASNEPINGTGDGDTAPDWQVYSSRYVDLRAERAGSGTGRIYTLTVQCADDSGNASSRSTQVVVPKSQTKK